jgi:hypothetical protein
MMGRSGTLLFVPLVLLMVTPLRGQRNSVPQVPRPLLTLKKFPAVDYCLASAKVADKGTAAVGITEYKLDLTDPYRFGVNKLRPDREQEARYV